MPTEQWITKEDMADALKKAKTTRKNKSSAFTRVKKRLDSLLTGDAEEDILKEVYTELADSFKALEKSNEDLCLLLDGQELDAEDSYLDTSADSLSEMQLKVNRKIKEKEQREKESSLEADKKKQFEGRLAALKASIQTFGKPSSTLSNLSIAKTISHADMRLEMKKVEDSLAKIQEDMSKVVDMDPSADLTAVFEQFNSLVVDEVDRCKSIALEYVKDAPSLGPAPVHGGGESRIGFSTTKRETVMLPKFSGDEKSAFLKYPVWKLQWEDHIREYEPRYRSTMLLNHLDEKATLQIIGLENNYDEAMKQLDNYYSNRNKVIKACLDEIRAYPSIGPLITRIWCPIRNAW